MVIGELIKINNMYQFSLSSFVKLFKRALETKPQASSTEEKLGYLSDTLIKLCFSEVGRSLFKADRLTYSLQFVKGIFPNLIGKIDNDSKEESKEWQFFVGLALAAPQNVQIPRWVPQDKQEDFVQLASSFPHLINAC